MFSLLEEMETKKLFHPSGGQTRVIVHTEISFYIVLGRPISFIGERTQSIIMQGVHKPFSL